MALRMQFCWCCTATLSRKSDSLVENPNPWKLHSAAPEFREIQAGELAVILPRRPVVGLSCINFATEVAQMYFLFLKSYPGHPFTALFFPANSFIFRRLCPRALSAVAQILRMCRRS